MLLKNFGQSVSLGHDLIIMGAFNFPLLDVPSFIGLALIVPEKHNITRKHAINLLSQ